ncbi:polysaccharide deacetylase family protein [Solirubrobacter phytolaccae]|uniref:Polysaccharide deacetylase family protein n=1 Tax=Solirubrobacter phytolaccae TaxID=1404360 RepID=A0A9X3NBH0_9ACTN|nr:polysaccharide deacetylase family protein [Solirubrobacter phytolaccae]MDA0183308.1 polysaccharide deacetylase family protein [Solirubrobacter phytolaccae]
MLRPAVLVACCLLVFVASARPATPARCSGGSVALTFDDGPAPTTPALLEALQRRGLRATMFNVGVRATAHPELVRAEARAGMWVENHTFTHRRLTALDDARVAFELAEAQRVLGALTGRTPTLMRPPYLATDARVERVAARLGLRQVLATVDTHDSRGASADAIADAAEHLRPGGILLLHDRPEAVDAVPRIADELAARGLCTGPIVIAR